MDAARQCAHVLLISTFAHPSPTPFHGLVLPDFWQQEAVHALRAGRDMVVDAPTGAGKTFVFELFQPELRGPAIFTVPTRARGSTRKFPATPSD